jgi:hypothetical protein
MVKCNECGYENMDGLDYCDGCGAKLEATASGPQGIGEQASAAPGSAPADTSESAAMNEITPNSEPRATESGMSGVQPSSGAVAQPPQGAEVPNERSATAGGPSPAQAPTGEMHAGAATPVSAVPFKAKLSIIRGGRRGQEFELEPGNNLIGRWDPETGAFPEVDLDADDPEAKVSRKHALIRIDSGRITIEDIGSLNGTYVNRQPRLQPGNPVELKDGDEIIIGKTFLKLSINPIS